MLEVCGEFVQLEGGPVAKESRLIEFRPRAEVSYTPATGAAVHQTYSVWSLLLSSLWEKDSETSYLAASPASCDKCSQCLKAFDKSILPLHVSSLLIAVENKGAERHVLRWNSREAELSRLCKTTP
ncbi:hypothetical protein P186_2468 [Pyrobaculum ferrireducens]|uniref:Uncharacterized protein n=1 Tax=Pyrobaculum ferrireducens TaxID=1104324 RepID=G7VCP9_9CREN|nr:hypothetical protein P186_2468 [Pyrobaculum ferrireducens]